MNMPPYKINFLNALVFIVCGMIAFFTHYIKLGGFHQTSLIPFVLGLLLMVMTPVMKSGSVLVSRAVTLLTLLFGVIVAAMLMMNMGSDKVTARKMILLTVMALSSFGSFGIYLNDWMEERKRQGKI